MKRLFLILNLFLLICACIAPEPKLPQEERNVKYIIEVPQKKKNELYRLSREWLAKAFKSSKDVIQYEDKEEGTIVGKGNMLVGDLISMPIWFTLTINVKDNKARAIFEAMHAESTTSLGTDKIPFDDSQSALTAFKKSSDPIMQNFENYLNKSGIQNEDNW